MSEQEQNEQEQPKRKGPGDCLTPAATLGLLCIGLLVQAVWWLT